MKVQTNAVEEICQLHTDLQGVMQTALEKAIRIGELLNIEKRKLEHGQWLPWLKANVPFAERTARNYLRVYQEQWRIKSASVADLNGAYKLLTPPPSKSESAVKHMGSLYDKLTKKQKAEFWAWAASLETDKKLKPQLEQISRLHNG